MLPKTPTIAVRQPSRWLPFALATLAGGALAACKKGPDQEYVQFANGFDFPVTATVATDGGKEQVIEIPAHGRVGADFEGKHKVKVTMKGGAVLADSTVDFGPSSKRKKKCQLFYNVLGSAAIVEEEVSYGIAGLPSATVVAGETLTRVCPQWGFETKEPPSAVRVKKGRMAADVRWLHYVDDGSWRAAVVELLRRLPKATDPLRRERSIRLIVRTVIAHDPQNPGLAQLKPLFAEQGIDFPEDYRELVKIIDAKKNGTAESAGRWKPGQQAGTLLASADNTVRDIVTDITPLLVLRCNKGEPLVFVQSVISKMEVHGSSVNLHTVKLAFDDEPAQTSVASEGGSQKVLVLKQPVALFKKILDANTLVFTHTRLDGNEEAIKFDLRNLDQVIWKLRESCTWKE